MDFHLLQFILYSSIKILNLSNSNNLFMITINHSTKNTYNGLNSKESSLKNCIKCFANSQGSPTLKINFNFSIKCMLGPSPPNKMNLIKIILILINFLTNRKDLQRHQPKLDHIQLIQLKQDQLLVMKCQFLSKLNQDLYPPKLQKIIQKLISLDFNTVKNNFLWEIVLFILRNKNLKSN